MRVLMEAQAFLPSSQQSDATTSGEVQTMFHSRLTASVDVMMRVCYSLFTRPTTCPSGSANIAKVTMFGIVMVGITVLPPRLSTFFK